MSRVLLVGGGTAGHVEPALAVGNWLLEHDSTITCEFLGTKEGIEVRLVPQAGFTLHTITKAALPRRFSVAALSWPIQFLTSIVAALRIVRSVDLVVGFGGYVSAPGYLAAKILRIPIIVHEANALPGWANRLGARLTQHVDIAFARTRECGRRWREANLVGMPIKSRIAEVCSITPIQRNEIRTRIQAEWKIALDRPVIVIFGGSLGARTINTVIAEFLAGPLADQFSIIHSVGKNDVLPQASSHYKPLTYIDNMADIYAIADLVIARSGAVSCAEIESTGVPAILVPLPIGNGEQEANASDLVTSGQATLVSNSQFTATWLEANILSTMTKANERRAGEAKIHGRLSLHASAAGAIGEQVLNILKLEVPHERA